MVLIQLLLPTSGVASADGVAPLAETRQTLAERFGQEGIHVRALPANCWSRTSMSKPCAIVTGASSGIGLELAAICAQEGFDLLVAADGDVVSGWKNKLQSAIANVTPAAVLAEQHRRMAEPGSAEKAHK